MATTGKVDFDSAYMPPPMGGMNTATPFMLLPKTDAFRILNFTLKASGIEFRPGVAYRTTTNLANDPKSLHIYAAVGGTSSVFATTDAGVFDTTSIAAAPAASIALTNGFTIGSVLSTGAQNYLTLVNGTDSMVQYDGATWTATATVGGGAINTNTFSFVEVYRQRLYFIVKNTTRLVYLNANSVTGGGTNYDTAAIFKRGGYLVAMATWTIDGGTGPDDHLVLVTSEGELAVFAGNDPATWSYKGTYYIAPPMGKRPFIKLGGDLIFLSQQGPYALSKALLVATLDRQASISEKIRPTFQQLSAAFGTSEKWDMVIDFTIPALLISTPSGSIFGMNTQTGSWFEWGASGSEWVATCMRMLGTSLVIGHASGTTRRVMTFGSNQDDVGTAITAEIEWGGWMLSPKQTVKVEKWQPLWRMAGTGSATMTANFQMGVGGALASFENTNTTSHTLESAWFGMPDIYSWHKLPVLSITLDAEFTSFAFSGINLLYRKGKTFMSSGISWTV